MTKSIPLPIRSTVSKHFETSAKQLASAISSAIKNTTELRKARQAARAELVEYGPQSSIADELCGVVNELKHQLQACKAQRKAIIEQMGKLISLEHPDLDQKQVSKKALVAVTPDCDECEESTVDLLERIREIESSINAFTKFFSGLEFDETPYSFQTVKAADTVLIDAGHKAGSFVFQPVKRITPAVSQEPSSQSDGGENSEKSEKTPATKHPQTKTPTSATVSKITDKSPERSRAEKAWSDLAIDAHKAGEAMTAVMALWTHADKTMKANILATLTRAASEEVATLAAGYLNGNQNPSDAKKVS